MERVAVVGCPGAGKTTLADALASSFDAPHVELDALYHGPDWTPTPVEEFREQLTAELSAPRWVACGNYNDSAQDQHLRRADTIVWLDLPRSLVMWRVVRRTIRRGVTRQRLWNDNREPLSNFWSWKPERNIVRWAWIHHPKYRARYEGALADGQWSHATVHRLRTRSQVDGFRMRLGAGDQSTRG